MRLKRVPPTVYCSSGYSSAPTRAVIPSPGEYQRHDKASHRLLLLAVDSRLRGNDVVEGLLVCLKPARAPVQSDSVSALQLSRARALADMLTSRLQGGVLKCYSSSRRCSRRKPSSSW